MATKRATTAKPAPAPAKRARPARVPVQLTSQAAHALDELVRESGMPAATILAKIVDDMSAHMLELAKIARQTNAGNAQAAKSALAKLLGEMFVDRFIAAEGKGKGSQQGLDL